MMKTLVRTGLTLGFFLCSGEVGQARELLGRAGLGYNAQFSNADRTGHTPAISLKYAFAPRSALEAVAGFYSGAGGDGVVALKYCRTIRSENYVNFYFPLGLGYLTSRGTSGIEILGGLGAEFFIPGVDSVGMAFEAGLSGETISSGTGSFVLKTFGASFLNAGMHYYF
jgi:hypothetical protein